MIAKRILRLLTTDEWRKGSLIFVGVLVNSVIEILGLASVVPVVGLALDPDAIQEEKILRTVFQKVQFFGDFSEKDFLGILCVLMVMAFSFKAIFGLGINLIQSRFAFGIANRLSGNIWTYHFSKKLNLLQQADSGKILAEINQWPVRFANTYLVGGILLLSEAVVVIVLLLGMLWYNLWVCLSMGLIVLIGALAIRRLTKARLEKFSAITKKLDPKLNSLVTGAINGFVEISTFGAFQSMHELFLKEKWRTLRVASNVTVMNFLPSKLYEVLAVIVIASGIGISLVMEQPEEEFLTLLSVMSLSAYRIMPSMSRINAVLMSMRAHSYVFEAVEKNGMDSNLHDVKPKFSQNDKVAIALENVSMGYGKRSKEMVVQGMSYTFEPGRITALIGPSGSGKTTILNGLLGLNVPDEGRIFLKKIGDSDDRMKCALHDDVSPRNWLPSVSFVSQHPFFFRGTVHDNLTFLKKEHSLNEEKVKELLKILDLSKDLTADPMTFPLVDGGGNLSGGQRQRLALVRAMCMPRPVLICDEVTSGLDDKMRDRVFDLLQERAAAGQTVIVVTHDSELIKRSDCILNLKALDI